MWSYRKPRCRGAGEQTRVGSQVRPRQPAALRRPSALSTYPASHTTDRLQNRSPGLCLFYQSLFGSPHFQHQPSPPHQDKFPSNLSSSTNHKAPPLQRGLKGIPGDSRLEQQEQKGGQQNPKCAGLVQFTGGLTNSPSSRIKPLPPRKENSTRARLRVHSLSTTCLHHVKGITMNILPSPHPATTLGLAPQPMQLANTAHCLHVKASQLPLYLGERKRCLLGKCDLFPSYFSCLTASYHL